MILQRLYDLGARKIVVFELGPIGCIPSIMRGLRPKGIKCDENKNKIVSLFNNELGLMLNNLSLTLQHSHFIIGRAHSLAYDAIINPAKYGMLMQCPCKSFSFSSFNINIQTYCRRT